MLRHGGPMKKTFVALLFLSAAAAAAGALPEQNLRWQRHAQQVNIIRDNWGIAHIYGRSDADTVFGAIYAQAEDDINRIERNYLNGLGWMAQAEGESAVYSDLRQRLFVDVGDLQRKYRASPEWLKTLMLAWSDGLNYFLAKHPAVKPKVIRHFEPWMALSFTEGSIGGDIESVDLGLLKKFYGGRKDVSALPQQEQGEPGGSNGIAIAPSNTIQHHSLLLINPHTSFFYRSELQMTSGEGLDAYGAVTWGQFFIYQGFNSRVGWMHTSSGVDAVDEYLETVHSKDGHYYYKYGNEERPVIEKQITVPY